MSSDVRLADGICLGRGARRARWVAALCMLILFGTLPNRRVAEADGPALSGEEAHQELLVGDRFPSSSACPRSP